MASPVPSNHHHCHLLLTSLLLLIPNFQILAVFGNYTYLHCLWNAHLPFQVGTCSDVLASVLGSNTAAAFPFPSLLFSSFLLVPDSAHLLALTVGSLDRYKTYLQPTVQGPQVSGGKGGVGYINWHKYWIKRGSLVRLTFDTQNAFWHKALQRWKQHSASLVLNITSFGNRGLHETHWMMWINAY